MRGIGGGGRRFGEWEVEFVMCVREGGKRALGLKVGRICSWNHLRWGEMELGSTKVRIAEGKKISIYLPTRQSQESR